MKHVVQYGVFAAYHLALETSFLADEGASLPELPFSSPITVALPDKVSGVDRSISTVPGFSASVNKQLQDSSPSDERYRPNSASSSMNGTPINMLLGTSTQLPITGNDPASQYEPDLPSFSVAGFSSDITAKNNEALLRHVSDKSSKFYPNAYLESKLESVSDSYSGVVDHVTSHWLESQMTVENFLAHEVGDNDVSTANPNGSIGESFTQMEIKTQTEDAGLIKEEFPPSPSDHQSILVSLSSRCVWKGTVCERSHLFRIKYYGNFDKPLGRFLRDHLFDQVPSLKSICICNFNNEFLTSLIDLRLIVAALVRCHRRPMFIVTLIVKELLLYLLKS